MASATPSAQPEPVDDSPIGRTPSDDESRRLFVALTHNLDVASWRQRNASGEVPDTTPYGLHHLANYGFDVDFSTPTTPAATPTPPGVPTRFLSKLSDAVHYRTGGLEFPHLLAQAHNLRRHRPAAVFSYDERAGFPAASVVSSRPIGPVPTVSGLAWLDRKSETPRVHRMAADHALKRLDLMFTQCAPMVEIIADEWQVPAERLRYVTLGIDTDFYTEQPWPAADAPPHVASAGEDRFRDHDLLIDALSQTRERIPNLHLELATGLPVTPAAGLATLYRERLNGRMRDLYARSSVVAVALHPTPTGSGLTVVLEAMASGRPVVVTDNPGISDYVTHGETGLLVPAGDVDAFAAAVESLLADPDRAREMGRNAAQVARRRFTSAQMARQFAELLAEVC